MPLLKNDTYTIDYIYSLPEGERAELIDGEIYNMAPPSTNHQRISTKLSSKINAYIEQKQGSCEVFSAPFAVFLNNDNTTYFEPDISVICDRNKLDQTHVGNGEHAQMGTDQQRLGIGVGDAA